ncbi:MAG: hypothetical protein M1819_004160 [Sarea resinae]|nr:MAG: hypothetical protein M1819_004160 [Sarea resinae]
MSTAPRILIYVVRRDLRLADNPIFHEIASRQKKSQLSFTHLLPIYVFPAQQIETSGFLCSDTQRSPYPEARSQVGGFWRCGHHRASFLAESIWDLKNALEGIGSGLEVRVGMLGDVVQDLLQAFKKDHGDVVGVWMTSEEGVEEKREENEIRMVLDAEGKELQLWKDEKYLVDDRDLPFEKAQDLPDVFTSFRKMVEPLREIPRSSLPAPSNLPPLPSPIPAQKAPFSIPSTFDGMAEALCKPLRNGYGLGQMPEWPNGATSAHPFHGGEKTGHDRIKHLVSSGSMSTYKDTRNGMLGKDFSTKLSAWLALGCVTARQIHEYLIDFENARSELGKGAQGYGKGENKGTAAVRFELLWRDYMRLCTRKFGPRLFQLEGFRNDTSESWKHPGQDKDVTHAVQRFLEGRTGIGLIDASMRELYLTGYTSNRARQNAASFLAKHLYIDWRIGAEWYESMLIDYDVSSNWGNWQYTSGVGNDPRGEGRVFNPVKQAFDYDPQGAYIKNWVFESRKLEDPQCIFQPWKVPADQRAEMGLNDFESVERPLKRIEYHVGGKKGGNGKGWRRDTRKGSERGGRGGHHLGKQKQRQGRDLL